MRQASDRGGGHRGHTESRRDGGTPKEVAPPDHELAGYFAAAQRPQ